MAEEKKNAKKSNSSAPSLPIEGIVLFLILASMIFTVIPDISGTFRVLSENSFIQQMVFTIKIISAVVSILAIVGTLYVIIRSSSLRPSFRDREEFQEITVSMDEEKRDASYAPTLQEAWTSITQRLEQATDQDAALLIIEADALLDQALKALRIPGATFGERLKYISGPDFKSTDDVWEAHKIRNQIAHEGSVGVHYSDAVYALGKFEKALKELEMI